jgi:hypothetical protein
VWLMFFKEMTAHEQKDARLKDSQKNPSPYVVARVARMKIERTNIFSLLESPRLVEITMKSRGLKKFGERGGRMVMFLLRPNCLLGAVEFVLGDKE